MAKRDTSNKKRVSIDAKHKLQQQDLTWKQYDLASSLNQAIKQVKHAVGQNKTECFAPTKSV
jgi:hypothetical protein